MINWLRKKFGRGAKNVRASFQGDKYVENRISKNIKSIMFDNVRFSKGQLNSLEFKKRIRKKRKEYIVDVAGKVNTPFNQKISKIYRNCLRNMEKIVPAKKEGDWYDRAGVVVEINTLAINLLSEVQLATMERY